MPKKISPPTLRDIAEEVGVTASTVSAVLNNAPKSQRYTEATKARIRETAVRLGYTSNPLAQALRGHSPRLLGFISYNVDSTYYGHILNAIENAAQAHDYHVVMANMQRSRERLEPCVQMMLRWRVRGILLGTIGNAMGEPLRRVFEEIPVPMVNLGSPEAQAPLHCINFDNRAAGRLVAEHLLRLGHRRAVMLIGSRNLSYFDERSSAFKETFEAKTGGFKRHVEVVEVPYPCDFAAAYATVRELIAARTQFSALVGANDPLSIGGMRALLDCGVDVPGAVSVAGVDDVPLASGGGEGTRVAAYLKPSMTTVRVPVATIARTGVEQLISMIESPEKPQRLESPASVLIPPELIVRESTAAVVTASA